MARSTNPADEIANLVRAINDSRAKLAEALDEIRDYSQRLHQLTADAGRRLLTRD
jgi:ABC-type transporter Mla subunit MlaD